MLGLAIEPGSGKAYKKKDNPQVHNIASITPGVTKRQDPKCFQIIIPLPLAGQGPRWNSIRIVQATKNERIRRRE